MLPRPQAALSEVEFDSRQAGSETRYEEHNLRDAETRSRRLDGPSNDNRYFLNIDLKLSRKSCLLQLPNQSRLNLDSVRGKRQAEERG